jgi:hypothetical protein
MNPSRSKAFEIAAPRIHYAGFTKRGAKILHDTSVTPLRGDRLTRTSSLLSSLRSVLFGSIISTTRPL